MIDFQRVCIDLRGVFGSMRQVARVMHYANPEYLTKLERGEIADPRYSLGESLIDLYRKHVDYVLPVIGVAKQARLI